MPREIKFRAWHKEKEQMLTVMVIDWESQLEGSEKVGFVAFQENIGGLDSYSEPSEPCYAADFDDVILLQFTGLHDKNGKEIYEGDVLKYFVGWKDEESTMLVESLDEWFENKGYAEEELGENWKNCEVIGNLYENLELLNSPSNCSSCGEDHEP